MSTISFRFHLVGDDDGVVDHKPQGHDQSGYRHLMDGNSHKHQAAQHASGGERNRGGHHEGCPPAHHEKDDCAHSHHGQEQVQGQGAQATLHRLILFEKDVQLEAVGDFPAL